MPLTYRTPVSRPAPSFDVSASPPICIGSRSVPHPGVTSEGPVVPLAPSKTKRPPPAFGIVSPLGYDPAALAATHATLRSEEKVVPVERAIFRLTQAGYDCGHQVSDTLSRLLEQAAAWMPERARPRRSEVRGSSLNSVLSSSVTATFGGRSRYTCSPTAMGVPMQIFLSQLASQVSCPLLKLSFALPR